MKPAFLLLAVLACGADETRSVRVVGPPEQSFRPAQSAALFVGVREFDDIALQNVPYAADDAVDLAFAFQDLVPPPNIVLALSGAPVKDESRLKLTQLLGSGAKLVRATRADIPRLLEQQTSLAGPNGLLILSIATHGFSSEGTPYVLAADSQFGDADTSLSASHLLDVAARAGRSLVFLDACRERVTDGRAPLRGSPALQAMRPIHGQVVFYAAAAGQYAYDHRLRRNGVFTAAVLDGLSCEAVPADNGFVTAEGLAAYVERQVKTFIKRNRNPDVKVATQCSLDGQTASLPLAKCGVPVPPPPNPQTVEGVERVVKTEFWSRTLDGLVTDTQVADLNGDESNEVIAAVGETIHVFNAGGHPMWSRNTKAPIRKFVISGKTIAALSRERLTILDGNGASRSCSPAGGLHEVVIDQVTARHARKVIVAGIDETGIILAMVDPKKCTPLWRRAIGGPGFHIEKLETTDADNDARRDITLTTSRGRVTVNFDGEVVETNISVVPIPKNPRLVSSN